MFLVGGVRVSLETHQNLPEEAALNLGKVSRDQPGASEMKPFLSLASPLLTQLLDELKEVGARGTGQGNGEAFTMWGPFSSIDISSLTGLICGKHTP